jgi:bifunctional non-homologous end joining protein LigD
MATNEQAVEVEGRRLMLRNLDKVLYPATGTTKGEVLHYVAEIAPVLLPHLADRPLSRMRWPDGVEGPMFVEKNLPGGTPAWVRRVRLPVPGSNAGRETIDYPVMDGLPALIWLANLAALELHAPQWTVGPRGAVHGPDRLVIDLDPGAPAGLTECARVALSVREKLAADRLECFGVTSGSKGMQLYAPISGKQDAELVHGYARRLAEQLEAEQPKLITSRMTKSLRPGKVLLDWSQNHPAKTTISPYSLRGRPQPWVATPLTWDEIEAGAAGSGSDAGSGSAGSRSARGTLVQLRYDQVLARVQQHGDLIAPLLTRGPQLPQH